MLACHLVNFHFLIRFYALYGKYEKVRTIALISCLFDLLIRNRYLDFCMFAIEINISW